MGLPQVPSSETGEEVEAASLGTFLKNPPQFTDVSTSDMDGMHSESMSPSTGNPPFSSKIDFCSNSYLELAKVNEDSSKFRGAMEWIKGGWFTPKSGRNIQNPVSRVVGFRSGGTSSLTNGHVHSSVKNNVTLNETECSGSLVRKRLLSPLSSILSLDQFNDDYLHIGCRNIQANSPALNDSFSISFAKDNKKANVGSQNHLTLTSFLEQSSKIRSQSGAISISPKMVVSPSLSLSPLGPKFSERMKTAGGCRTIENKRENSHLTLKNIEQSFGRSDKGIILAREEEDYRFGSKSFEEIYILQQELRPSSLESNTDVSWPFPQESAPTSQCVRLVRSLSGLPVRRSLVGSFEESLLSGC
ncbi:hypothetical protein I3760_01G040200 [Carya illinoinensis]|nr:hypothetical protein I3760_01G040200 [Carya illinoinensis]